MQLQRRPSGLPDWLYVAIVAALGLYFIIGAIAWTTFIYNRIPPCRIRSPRSSPQSPVGWSACSRPPVAQLDPRSPAGNNVHRWSDRRRTFRIVKHQPLEASAPGRTGACRYTLGTRRAGR